MKVLFEAGFKLPIASALLSVLYPNNFSIYDYRVCDKLQDSLNTRKYHLLQNWTFERLWDGYEDYLEKVLLISKQKNYRDADRYLWGKSFHDQLIKDLRRRFIKD